MIKYSIKIYFEPGDDSANERVRILNSEEQREFLNVLMKANGRFPTHSLAVECEAFAWILRQGEELQSAFLHTTISGYDNQTLFNCYNMATNAHRNLDGPPDLETFLRITDSMVLNVKNLLKAIKASDSKKRQDLAQSLEIVLHRNQRTYSEEFRQRSKSDNIFSPPFYGAGLELHKKLYEALRTSGCLYLPHFNTYQTAIKSAVSLTLP